MKKSNKPKLVSLKTGSSVKVIQVNGQANISMPFDFSTKGAVVIVVEGSALLKIDEKEHWLEKGIHLLFQPVKTTVFC